MFELRLLISLQCIFKSAPFRRAFCGFIKLHPWLFGRLFQSTYLVPKENVLHTKKRKKLVCSYLIFILYNSSVTQRNNYSINYLVIKDIIKDSLHKMYKVSLIFNLKKLIKNDFPIIVYEYLNIIFKTIRFKNKHLSPF